MKEGKIKTQTKQPKKKRRIIKAPIEAGHLTLGYSSFPVKNHEVIGLKEDDPIFPIFKDHFGLKIIEVEG